MVKRAYGEMMAKILIALKEFGPMTRAELQDHLKIGKLEFGGRLGNMTRPSKREPQRIHICGYTRDHEGARRYPRAIYAYGPGENAKKPSRPTKRERVEYDRRLTNKIRNTSVFNLGLTRNAIRQMKKNVRPTEVHMGQGS